MSTEQSRAPPEAPTLQVFDAVDGAVRSKPNYGICAKPVHSRAGPSHSAISRRTCEATAHRRIDVASIDKLESRHQSELREVGEARRLKVGAFQPNLRSRCVTLGLSAHDPGNRDRRESANEKRLGSERIGPASNARNCSVLSVPPDIAFEPGCIERVQWLAMQPHEVVIRQCV